MHRRAIANVVVLLVTSSLVVWATIAVAVVLHELGHTAAARAAGAEPRGIVVEWTLDGGTYVDHPFVEHPEPAAVLDASGLLVHVPLGLLALAVWRTPLGRRVLAVPVLAMVCLGGSAMALALYGLTGHAGPVADLVRLTAAAGWSRPWVRTAAAAIGISGALVVGTGYALAVLRWGCRAWPCARAAERRVVLLTAAGGPLVLYVLSHLVRFLVSGSPPGSRVAAETALIGACLAAAWLVADLAPPPPPQARPRVETATARRRSLAGAALLALAAAALVAWVNARFDPTRLPDTAALAALARRHPSSERHLRLAGYWSLRGRRVDEARAYYARAVEVAPDSPGALHDLAVAQHASGHPEAALDLLRRARAAGPGIAGIAAKAAQVQEQLGRLDRAARSWRDYADLVENGSGDPDSRRRHARMARGRARRLELEADVRRLAGPGR